jgi:hypothetical protein
MKPIKKPNHIILLILSLVSFFYLIFFLFQVNTNLAEALNIVKSPFETLDYFMGFGYLFILLFHFYALIFIFAHFSRRKEYRILSTVLLILGVLSLFSIGVEKVMIDDIAKEYSVGAHVSELAILNFAYIINTLFASLVFLYVLKTVELTDLDVKKNKSVDERIFTIAQCMGILSGIMGLLITFGLIRKNVLMDKLWIYIPFFILYLVPYALAVFYWLSLKRKQRIKDWYDEKQLQDILKSSLVTLLLSIPGLALFLFLESHIPFYFFLYYLFFVLLIFSMSTLYFYRIKDID